MKGPFSHGYGAQYNPEKFKIVDVDTSKPKPLYVLKSTNNNETIEGKFYESDIFANAT